MKNVLVIGGAGFIGSNLSNRLLEEGHQVTVFDSLARRGSELNIAWLEKLHGHRLEFIKADVRNFEAVRAAVRHANAVYHFAAQVAVTTSVDQPRDDFEINALGTFNVLEAVRLSGNRPPMVFTSTNKVYGGLEDVETVQTATRYEFRDLTSGVSESRPLDFHSPYGCSKGAADQYVRDYHRIYGLPTVVFRMSCIYGPRQFGNEDQGWVAHFIIAAQTGQTLTIYGDGKQVRDVLFVDDLVRALRAATDNIGTTAGQIFNIGGGPSNTLSIWHEFGAHLQKLNGKDIPVRFDSWRPGDQPCYVSDIRKAESVMGWRPQVDKVSGVEQLWKWVADNPSLFAKASERAAAVDFSGWLPGVHREDFGHWGAGFIGSHMAQHFFEAGHEVFVIDNESTGNRENLPAGVHFFKGDVAVMTDLEPVFPNGLDAVLQIAGQVSLIRSFTDPVIDLRTNVEGTLNVLQCCIRHRVSRLIYASSMTAYGHTTLLPTPETAPCEPVSYYGITKYAGERYVRTTAERVDLDFDFRVTCFRMYNVYGPRQALNNPYQGVLGIFLGNIQRGEPITIFGDGEQSRDFVYIDDIVSAWDAALSDPRSYGGVFNLGSGKRLSIRQVADEALAAFGLSRDTYPIIQAPARPGEQRHVEADVTRIRTTLGWEPRTSFDKGLRETVKWARQTEPFAGAQDRRQGYLMSPFRLH